MFVFRKGTAFAVVSMKATAVAHYLWANGWRAQRVTEDKARITL